MNDPDSSIAYASELRRRADGRLDPTILREWMTQRLIVDRRLGRREAVDAVAQVLRQAAPPDASAASRPTSRRRRAARPSLLRRRRDERRWHYPC
jgi:hypothetical protein